MKSSRLLPFVAVWSHALGYSLFGKPLSEEVTANDSGRLEDVTFDFNPSELIDPKSRRPKIYSKAIIELKRLEEEPLCHRMAAQLLINNCRGLEDIDEHNYDAKSNLLQRSHVESFACSLAICDMERARSPIPEHCAQYASSSLLRAARDVNSKLEVSPGQVGDCLNALTDNPNHWNTWLSYRDRALLFCRAARADIDKDNSIGLHKNLTKILENFTNDLQVDLDELNQKIANSGHAADSYFEKMSSHVEVWTSKVQNSLESVSMNVEIVKSSMKSVADTTSDAALRMEKFISTFLQGHAQMANEQEKALGVTTNKVQLSMADLSDLVGEAHAGTMELKATLQLLVPMVLDISSRQAAIEDKSVVLFSNLVNATELLQTHMQKLAQAETAVSGIHENLDRAAEAVKSWSENLPAGRGWTDWGLRLGTPLAALILGNYGITPTITMNAVFLVSGLLGGETVVQLRHLELWHNCTWMWWQGSDSEKPYHPHLSREQSKSSLATTPVEFETVLTSDNTVPSFEAGHVDIA
ncbi:hypothetical protein N431DRAFT_325106 [Stipitochalara longipes BDJ]|nr:hypothetical protein N431DRAFT_325106 [Stipitochalara longipes BDJ]